MEKSETGIAGKKNIQKKKKNSEGPRWVLCVFLLSIALSAVLSLLSNRALDGAGLLVAFLVLAVFISLGILFDIIGVAATAADPRPFHSMAAHRERGAREALMLLRNASKVSSVCNDVVGDICGIVSGTTAAVIVVELGQHLTLSSVLLSLCVTALVSGITIGGKAIGKSVAMRKSTQVVHLAGQVLALFSRK